MHARAHTHQIKNDVLLQFSFLNVPVGSSVANCLTTSESWLTQHRSFRCWHMLGVRHRDHGDLCDSLKWTVHGDLCDSLKWAVHGDVCDSLKWTLGFWGLSLATPLALPAVMYYEQNTALRELDRFPSWGGNAWILLLNWLRHKGPLLVSGSFVRQLVPAGIIR